MNLQEIKEALLYGDQNIQHSSALFAEGRDPGKWREIRESSYYKEELQAIRNAGERYLREPIHSLRFSDYKIFDTTGSRKEYQKEYFSHRGRLNAFAILALAYGEDKYLSALEDAIWAICDEYSWCLPACMDGQSIAVIQKSNAPEPWNDKINKNIREHDKIVDLFAAETSYTLSEICSLLEHRLAPLVVHRARKLILERVLEPYCEINSMFWWETCTNNWAAVCAGSVGAAALYLIKDSMVLTPVLLKLLNALKSFLSGYEEDGACTEGLGYWNYGFGFYVYFAELLRQRTAGRIDLMQGEKVKAIALFQQKCLLGGNSVVSFSDGAIYSNFNPGLTNYLKNRFEEVEIPDISYRSGFSDDPCYRWAADSRNLIWSHAAMKGSQLTDASYYLKDAGWLISRKKTDNSLFVFAAKGGHNGESHNHNDIGSFILNINGDSILTDLGAGEYTKQYFGPERYDYLCNSSRGHSVPIIDGTYQGAGTEYAARILEQASSEDGDVFTLDIAKAYPDNNLISLTRNFAFRKGIQPVMVLKDTYVFGNEPAAVIERFVTLQEPKLLQPGKVQISAAGGSIILTYDPNKLDFSIEKDVFLNHGLIAQDVYFVDLKAEQLKKKFTAEISFELKDIS
ncbi:hypothetical protein HNQ56_004732 [Anaerotaenia torta]|uniref:heparinase II/III domain-containing protein n=1 Tax=Anaerotaenia torta TaxID=433293 RepID=UPI003D1DB936